MNKIIKLWEVMVLTIAILFSMVSPVTANTAGAETVKTTFPVHVIHKTGDDKENFVIVIMGDGYTKEQQDTFLEDATKKAQGLLTWSPYKEYSDRINIYAVQVASKESGVGVYGGESVDTYFHVKVRGKAAGFTEGGDEKAKALRQELEENYLDKGANVGTIHIISNDDGSYGASVNSMFSFSSNSGDNIQGTVMAHEIAHSIGGLGDEYERYTNKPNTSDTADPDKIKWSKMLGFRGIGVTTAGTETAFAPSRECMMRWTGQPFCEVCKLELARKLNNPDYVSRPKSLYISDPELTIPHSKTGTLDRDSEKYRITEKNITKANDEDLEFRTIVQNMENWERNLKIRLRIIGGDGTTVLYEKEKDYKIPALSNSYDPDAARESLSLVLPDVYGLYIGNHIQGEVVDTDTGEILATDKTGEQSWSQVRIHYAWKQKDGTTEELADATTAKVYVPKGSSYTLRNPQLFGYTYTGNSVKQDQIKVEKETEDITYYYEKSSEPSQDVEEKTAECTTNPVQVTYDGNAHTFSITPGAGVQLRYSMEEGEPYTITEMPSYTKAGKYTVYFEAFADSLKSYYGQAMLEITKAPTKLCLVPETQNGKGTETVTLKVEKQGIPTNGAVKLFCKESGVTMVEKQNGEWWVTFPNEGKTYTFTARYEGNDNYMASEDSCQITVTKKDSQGNENADPAKTPNVTPPSGTPTQTPKASSTAIPIQTPKVSPTVIPTQPPKVSPSGTPTETPKVSPGKTPGKKPVKKAKGITVIVKWKGKKNASQIRNINGAVKKAVKKAEKKARRQGKKITVRIETKIKGRKKQTLQLDKATIKYLHKKKVKELQWDTGAVRITISEKTIKKAAKQIKKTIYLNVKKVKKKKGKNKFYNSKFPVKICYKVSQAGK